MRPHEDLSSIYRVSESIDPRFSSNPRKCYDRSYSSRAYFLSWAVCAARGHAPVAVGTKLFVTSVKRMRYEPSSAPPLERMPPSPTRHCASSWLPGHPALRATFFWHARAHAGSLECCAPWRRLRWQDASSSGRRRIQTESGGTRVPRHAPMVIWSVWPCEREVRDCARPVQRSIVYV